MPDLDSMSPQELEAMMEMMGGGGLRMGKQPKRKPPRSKPGARPTLDDLSSDDEEAEEAELQEMLAAAQMRRAAASAAGGGGGRKAGGAKAGGGASAAAAVARSAARPAARAPLSVSIPGAGVPLDTSKPVDQQWFQAAKLGLVAELMRLHAQQPELLSKCARGIGHTALHWSAAAGHVGAVEWLVEAGADPNVRNAGESTPLHSAAGGGHLPVVALLLRNGADVRERRAPEIARYSSSLALGGDTLTLPPHDVAGGRHGLGWRDRREACIVAGSRGGCRGTASGVARPRLWPCLPAVRVGRRARQPAPTAQHAPTPVSRARATSPRRQCGWPVRVRACPRRARRPRPCAPARSPVRSGRSSRRG
jgi:hypothetical protein